LLSLSCSMIAQPKAVAYLIPEGYTGDVIVLYKQKDGILPDTSKEGLIEYRIPADGFLKVNAEEPEVYNYSFYAVNAKNERTRIEYILPEFAPVPKGSGMNSEDMLTEEQRNTGIYAMNHRTIGFKVNGESVPLYAFSVGYPTKADSYYNKTNFRLSDIRQELETKQ
jgi:hypothetical protein